MSSPHKKHRGFTLVEMIMVIVITGIIGGMVAVFLKAPVQQYMDVARRAELTDIADTAIRRISRDIRIAVPNGVRIPSCGTTPCFEFLPTKDGGRFRIGPPGDTLIFGAGDTSFDFIGTANVAVGDYVVIGSTQQPTSIAFDTGVNGVLRQVTAVSGVVGARTGATIASGLLSDNADTQRFAVVEGGPVTYACIVPGGGACPNTLGVTEGTCQLVRYSGYVNSNTQTLAAIQAAIPNPPILADKISYCQIDLNPLNLGSAFASTSLAIVAVRLTVTSGGESVSLYNEIHVNNAP